MATGQGGGARRARSEDKIRASHREVVLRPPAASRCLDNETMTLRAFAEVGPWGSPRDWDWYCGNPRREPINVLGKPPPDRDAGSDINEATKSLHPRSGLAFGLWTLADGHHDVNIGCALPHREGTTPVGVSGYALQLCLVGNDQPKVRSGLRPLVVTSGGFCKRVGVAASHITRQHVGDADFVSFEGLLS